MTLRKFSIKGMHCKSCKMLIEDVMEDMKIKVNSLEVDEGTQIGILEVETEETIQKIIDTIKEETEYETKEIK